MTSGSLRNYYREKIDEVENNASGSKSFEYKAKKKKRGETSERPSWPGNLGDTMRPPQPPVSSLKVEVIISLKYLSNFWRYLDIPMISCELELDLSWQKLSIDRTS